MSKENQTNHDGQVFYVNARKTLIGGATIELLGEPQSQKNFRSLFGPQFKRLTERALDRAFGASVVTCEVDPQFNDGTRVRVRLDTGKDPYVGRLTVYYRDPVISCNMNGQPDAHSVSDIPLFKGGTFEHPEFSRQYCPLFKRTGCLLAKSVHGGNGVSLSIFGDGFTTDRDDVRELCFLQIHDGSPEMSDFYTNLEKAAENQEITFYGNAAGSDGKWRDIIIMPIDVRLTAEGKAEHFDPPFDVFAALRAVRNSTVPCVFRTECHNSGASYANAWVIDRNGRFVAPEWIIPSGRSAQQVGLLDDRELAMYDDLFGLHYHAFPTTTTGGTPLVEKAWEALEPGVLCIRCETRDDGTAGLVYQLTPLGNGPDTDVQYTEMQRRAALLVYNHVVEVMQRNAKSIGSSFNELQELDCIQLEAPDYLDQLRSPVRR